MVNEREIIHLRIPDPFQGLISEESKETHRGEYQPGKNHKYFKKRKLNIEFQIFFSFNILLQKSYFDIKMLHNIVNKNNMNKTFSQKDIFF